MGARDSNPQPFPSGFPVQTQDFPFGGKLQWTGTAPVDPDSSADASVRWATWSPGIIDLRAELGNGKDDSRLGVAPITGPVAGLFVYLRIKPWTTAQIEAGASLKYLRILMFEGVSATRLKNLYAVTGEQEVSMDLMLGNPPHQYPSTVTSMDPTTVGMGGQIVLAAPGAGGPFRYWQPTLVFRQWKRMADPVIDIDAVVY